jgi:hypothetical protein
LLITTRITVAVARATPGATITTSITVALSATHGASVTGSTLGGLAAPRRGRCLLAGPRARQVGRDNPHQDFVAPWVSRKHFDFHLIACATQLLKRQPHGFLNAMSLYIHLSQDSFPP